VTALAGFVALARDLGPGREASPGAVLLAAGLAGVAYVWVAARAEQRAWWALPLVAFAAAVAAGTTFMPSLAAGVVVGVVAAAAWGPLPWSSRYVGPFASSWCSATRRPVLVLTTFGPSALVIVSVCVHGTVRASAAAGAVAVAELGVFAAALAVRLWRFAPRRRTFDVAALAIAAFAAVVPLVDDDVPVAIGALLVCSAVTAFVALPFVREGIVTRPRATSHRAQPPSRRERSE
jgi:hypothetical protein